MDFAAIQAVVMDMDGVLWRGTDILPGMQDFFVFLREHNLPFALATNNSSRLPSQYVEKLANMGVPDIQESQIISSGTATASYLQNNYPAGTEIFVVGMDGLRQMVADAGFVVTDEDAEVVVTGIDFEFNYETAKRATLMIRNGADFIGTNPDLTFPSPEGLVPGAGSVIAMIQAATDITPVIIGKPYPAMFEAALRTLNTPAQNTLMIGDRLNTDIEGAQTIGMKSALVLTGVTTPEEASNSDIQPDIICTGLPDLMQKWTATDS